MPIYLLRNSCLSSILFLLTFCTVPRNYKLSGKEKTVKNTFAEAAVGSAHGLKYKMSVQLYKNYFTGLLIYKKTDSASFHLAFITELGLKMFEMEIKDNTLTTLYCFAPLNKPKIKQILENDLKFLLLIPLTKATVTEYTNDNGSRLITLRSEGKKYIYRFRQHEDMVLKGVLKKGAFTKVKSQYFYDDNSKIPGEADLKHKGLLRLKINLNQINEAATHE